MRRIPKSLQLLGHTITVHVVSQRDWDALAEKYEEMDDAVGVWDCESNTIVLLRQKRSQLWHAYCHELWHAILYFANSPMTHDEAFVDVTGALLAQALETSA